MTLFVRLYVGEGSVKWNRNSVVWMFVISVQSRVEKFMSALDRLGLVRGSLVPIVLEKMDGNGSWMSGTSTFGFECRLVSLTVHF